MKRIDSEARIEEASRAQALVTSALLLAQDTGQAVMIKPDPDNPTGDNTVVYELESLPDSDDASPNAQLFANTNPTEKVSVGIDLYVRPIITRNGDIFTESDTTEPKANHKKKRRARLGAPNPNLDPLTAPPQEVVRTPQGRARAREVIADTTLTNHISSNVVIDETSMLKAGEVLTAPLSRKELANRLAVAQTHHRNGNRVQPITSKA